MTQNEKVLRHLRDFGSITPMEALQDYGIMRLGARIWELKKDGHRIDRMMEEGVNRYGEKTRWARYYLRGDRGERGYRVQGTGNRNSGGMRG